MNPVLRSVTVQMVRVACAGLLFLATTAVELAQQPPTQTPVDKTGSKPKKVITNDDIQPSAPDKSNAERKPSAPGGSAKDSVSPLARQLHAKLEKLNAQLKDLDVQIAGLKKFQTGETDGNAGHELHQGYRRTPIPAQIEKLETKRKKTQDQISAIYDEARQKGIPPGDLR